MPRLPFGLILGVLVSYLAASFQTHIVSAAEPASPRLPGHHNLFNGDCTFLFGERFVEDPKARYDARTLHWFIDLIADCGVDTYLCNLNAQVPWYPSQRTPNILAGYKRGDREFFRKHFRADSPRERVEAAMDD